MARRKTCRRNSCRGRGAGGIAASALDAFVAEARSITDTAHAKFDSTSDIAFVSSNGVRLLLDVGSAQCGEAVVTERLAVQVFDQGLVTRDLTATRLV